MKESSVSRRIKVYGTSLFAILGVIFEPMITSKSRISRIKAFLLTEQTVVSELLPAQLEKLAAIKILGIAPFSADPANVLAHLRPQVLLFDAAIGQAKAERLCVLSGRVVPAARKLFFNAAMDADSLLAAFRAGVTGYLGRDAPVSELAASIILIRTGGIFIGSFVARLSARGLRSDWRGHALCSLHSPREAEIMQMRSEHLCAKEIAAALSISRRTVEKHLENIARKNRQTAVN
ncbi:MAG: LuxR C-terminal-related transcriptional regulator [Verrucomicrobiota bacterium]